jgi:hypothetical protein
MLVEFRFSNFRSFKDEQVLSLVASSDKIMLEPNTMEAPELPGKRLLRSCEVYGPNASGKSNLFAAIRFARRFVVNSADRPLESETGAEPFRLDDQVARSPSRFEFVFIEGGVRYDYGFTADHSRVYAEWLTAYPKRLPQRWFVRSWSPETQSAEFKFGSHLRGEKDKLIEVTRADVLLLSTGAKFNNPQLRPVYEWFSRRLKIIGSPSSSASHVGSFTARECVRDPVVFQRVGALLRDADLGVLDLEIEEKTKDFPQVPNELPERIRKPFTELIKAFEDGLPSATRTSWAVRLKHRTAQAEPVTMSWEDESDGTRRLFELAGPWFDALSSGLVIAVDELSASMHPLLARELIAMFHDSRTNQHGAQLIFSTHDTALLDENLVRRDQVWFLEKDNDGASSLYPLSDYRPRSGEALAKGYLAGRYGSIPIIGDFRSVAGIDAKED